MSKPDPVDLLNRHVEAKARATEWAKKAVAYREAGKNRQANEAESKVKHWLKIAMAIERRGKRPPPHD